MNILDGHFPDIGRDLGVRYVLEGSVRRAGGKIRINAQLITAETGGHVWAEKFDGAADQLLDLFWDDDAGGVFTTGNDAPTLIVTSIPVSLSNRAAASRITSVVQGHGRTYVTVALPSDSVWYVCAARRNASR